MSGKILLPDEFTLPDDLRNYGGKCSDCGAPKVVYQITTPAPGFPKGTYCYKCLLNHCRISSRFPVPIEMNLANCLERDLGLTGPGKKFFFMGTSGIPGY